MNVLQNWARLAGALLLMAMLGGCGRQPASSPPGQALASVNGVEITVLQLNDELARAGASASNVGQEAASKQLLQALIDRQLLLTEAAREKLDRDPKVMQAIDRARALIVAQAWLQKRIGNLDRPAASEVEAYFAAHPQFFASRRQFTMDQLQIPVAALTPALRHVVDAASSLDDVAKALAANQVQMARSRVTRSTADLAPALANRLLAMRKGMVFAVQEGDRALVVALQGVEDAPVTLAVARPQIEQFLMKQRQKEAASAELVRLRASARIDYLNKALADASDMTAQSAVKPDTPVAALPTAPAPARQDATANAALDRGVAGLK